MVSLEKEPANGGMPAWRGAADEAVQYVMGMYLRSPPIFLIVLLVVQRDNHRARAEEEHRLEEGVGHEVENAHRVGAGAERTVMYPSCESVE